MGESGSYTIEAALTMPLVLICMALIVIFGMYLFDKAVMYRDAAVAADRTAYFWEQSSSGKGENDGTDAAGVSNYWQWLTENIGVVLGFGGGSSGKTVVTLPAARDVPAGRQNPLAKLKQAANGIPSGLRGSLEYSNRLFEREVKVSLEREFSWGGFAGSWLGTKQSNAISKSVIVDPAEWIRTVDLVRTYVPRVKMMVSPEGQSDQNETEEPLPSDTGETREPAITIRSEAQASAYIRSLVGGEETSFPTEQTGEWRVVDALDSLGVAHEAKYTVNQSDAKDQIAKDVELMQEGYIKGAVWHFFRMANGSTGLTDALRNRLEENGIVAIVHN